MQMDGSNMIRITLATKTKSVLSREMITICQILISMKWTSEEGNLKLTQSKLDSSTTGSLWMAAVSTLNR